MSARPAGVAAKSGLPAGDRPDTHLPNPSFHWVRSHPKTAAAQSLAQAGRALLEVAAVVMDAALRRTAVSASIRHVAKPVAAFVSPSDGLVVVLADP